MKIVSGEFLADALVKEKIVSSKSDFRRLVDEGAIHNLESGEKITDQYFKLNSNISLKIGKRRFVKIILN